MFLNTILNSINTLIPCANVETSELFSLKLPVALVFAPWPWERLSLVVPKVLGVNDYSLARCVVAVPTLEHLSADLRNKLSQPGEYYNTSTENRGYLIASYKI